MTEENEIVTKGYLTTFFFEINYLKKSLTGYRSIILRIKQSGHDLEKINKNISTFKMDEELRNGLINWSDNVRDNVESSFCSYNALIGTIPKLESKDLEELSKKIKNIFSPQIEDVEKYTYEIHKCFVQSTVREILNKMDITYQSGPGEKTEFQRSDINI